MSGKQPQMIVLDACDGITISGSCGALFQDVEWIKKLVSCVAISCHAPRLNSPEMMHKGPLVILTTLYIRNADSDSTKNVARSAAPTD
jgi:hypothetical protein